MEYASQALSRFRRFRDDTDTSCSCGKSPAGVNVTKNGTMSIATSKPRTRCPMLDRFLKEPAQDGHYTGLGRNGATNGKSDGNTKL
jgi:hypothetical protein